MASIGNSGGGEEKARKMVEEMGKTLKEGEKLLGPTRRPDGTLRKLIRTKAGYVPQDEVSIYQSRGSLWKKEKESQVGPPGYEPETEAKPKNKPAKRNEKRKEKKQQAAQERSVNSESEIGGSTEEWQHAQDVESVAFQAAQERSVNSESEIGGSTEEWQHAQDVESVAFQVRQLALSTSTAVGKSSSNSMEDLNTDDKAVDIDKKIRALKKKIRLAVAQLQKAAPKT